MDQSLLAWLSLITLVIVAAVGIVQWMRVRRSQAKRGEHPGGTAGPN